MDGNSDINIQGENLERINTFKYLGATLADNGDLDTEMTHRIQSGLKNWKRISGILCDRRISFRVKGGSIQDSCKTGNFVRCRDVGNEESTREEVGCGGMSGVTKLDRIRNERIRGTTKVGEISKKVQESPLKWYGNVLRREDECVSKRVMGIEVPGERRR